MTREQAIREITEAGGVPSNSAFLKYGIPERPHYCRFPSRAYEEMADGELMVEVRAARVQANGRAK